MELVQHMLIQYRRSVLQIEGTVGGKVLDKVANTMTDRILSEAKGQPILRLKCAMHPLDATAREWEKAAKGIEKESCIEGRHEKWWLSI